ncbi:glucokinase [Candidatus Nitrosoglobus terrae]|uniref:Glucokinase n=1 Tax=Candidatus Nitrosoglobus terrae TaxID=1630141 RepID=A0A1Q2SMV1_9GAMM|nr:glucokinase [Candidatus Nitrosoglobus terrae]BAW80443.1 glucokinase [Candidatus Nitrosoglobus terrae]
MKVLAADIGGTKTLLQVVDWPIGMGDRRVLADRRYSSRDYSSFDDLLQVFLAEIDRTVANSLASACFGVAGPIVKGIAKATNLPWQLDSDHLQQQFNLPQIALINDFQAQGYGIECLKPDDFAVLQLGESEQKAPQALIGAGTGLGQALLVWREDLERYQVLPTEGGHVDFAPMGEMQIELLRYLSHSLEHVSYEHLLSGNGLVNIYHFLKENGKVTENPALRMAINESDDPPAAISNFALERVDPLANQALNLFAQIYGAQAGNLALTSLSRGGVFIGGGIAPKILKRLQGGDFMKAFLNKGRLSALLQQIPVKVILEPKVGLWGAALVAMRLAHGKS